MPTVLFKFSQPIAWFFTNRAGIVKKKDKKKLNFAEIEKDFLKKSNPCGVVAMLVEAENEGG